jgi:AbiV family abortive infection protein
MTTAAPSPDQIVDLITACLENAAELIFSAQLLAEHDQPAISAAFSVLALEELGKAALADGLANSIRRPERIERFREGYAHHTYKLNYVKLIPGLQLSWTVIEGMRDRTLLSEVMQMNERWHKLRGEMRALRPDLGELKSLHRLKIQALYVEVSKDNSVIRPSDVVDQEYAALLFRCAKHGVASMCRVWGATRPHYASFVARIRSQDEPSYQKVLRRVERWTNRFIGDANKQKDEW